MSIDQKYFIFNLILIYTSFIIYSLDFI